MGMLDEYRSGWRDSRHDALAIDDDWAAVGDDLRAAMTFYYGELVHE